MAATNRWTTWSCCTRTVTARNTGVEWERSELRPARGVWEGFSCVPANRHSSTTYSRQARSGGSPVAIKIATICGSVRPGNYTSMALRLALDEFAKSPGVEVTPIQLDTLDLPLPGL